MTKTPPTLGIGDAVVLLLSNGCHQSATVTHFSLKGESHRYAHFRWKTGPGRYEYEEQAVHSSKWARFVVAVFPKDSKFLAV